MLSLLIQGLPERWLDLTEASFLNLDVLVCNRFRSEHVAIFRAFACGVLPKLNVLCCSYDVLESTSYKLTAVECVHVRDLYETFVAQRNHLKPGLRIFIQGLRFDPTRPYADCGYHLKLVQLHFNNVLDGFEVQSCYTVWSADYLDLVDTFWKIESGPLHFCGVYPNLRVIIVDNTPDRQIEPLPLRVFLQTYGPLTELELRFCNFEPAFYAQLMELSNLATLHSLVVLERRGKYAHRINFEFLRNRFGFLRKFHTNLATVPVMLQLFESMQIGANFMFDFSVHGDTFRRCSIFRRRETYYELRAEVRHSQEPGVREIHRETFEHLADLKGHLTKHNPNFVLRHWLDGVAS